MDDVQRPTVREFMASYLDCTCLVNLEPQCYRRRR